MSSAEPIATTEKKSFPWWIAVVAVVISLLLLLSRFGGGESVTDKYNRLNQEARNLSQQSLTKWQDQEPLTEDDKANLAGASLKFEEMLKTRPEAWDAHAGASLVYSALDQWEKATPHIEFDLAHQPSNPSPDDLALLGELHYLHSQALFLTGKSAEAEKAADEALKIAKTPDFYYERAQARAQLHKLEEAEEDCRQGLIIAPDNSRLQSLLKFISGMK